MATLSGKLDCALGTHRPPVASVLLAAATASCVFSQESPRPSTNQSALSAPLGELTRREFQASSPFPASGASISSDGIGGLVAWTESDATRFAVFAARIGADSGLLDSEGINVRDWGPRVAHTATVFVDGAYFVLWDEPPGVLVGIRILSDGGRLDPQPMQIMTPRDGGVVGGFSVAAAGDAGFIVAWTSTASRVAARWLPELPPLQPSGDVDLGPGGAMGVVEGPDALLVPINDNGSPRAVLLSKTASVLAMTTGLDSLPGTGGAEGIAAAWNGLDFQLAWISNSSGGRVYASQVSKTGAVVDQPRLLFQRSSSGLRLRTIAAASSGAGVIVAWQNGLEVDAVHVDTSGTAMDAGLSVIVPSGVQFDSPLILSTQLATPLLLAHRHLGSLWGTSFSPGLVPFPDRDVQLNSMANPQGSVWAARTGRGAWIAWKERDAPSGSPLGSGRVGEWLRDGGLPIAASSNASDLELGSDQLKIASIGGRPIVGISRSIELSYLTDRSPDGGWSSVDVGQTVHGFWTLAASDRDAVIVYLSRNTQEWTAQWLDSDGALDGPPTLAARRSVVLVAAPALAAVGSTYLFFDGTNLFRLHRADAGELIDAGTPLPSAPHSDWDDTRLVAGSQTLLLTRTHWSHPTLDTFLLSRSQLRVEQTRLIAPDAGARVLDAVFDGAAYVLAWEDFAGRHACRIFEDGGMSASLPLGSGGDLRFVSATPLEWLFVTDGPVAPRGARRLTLQRVAFVAQGGTCGTSAECATGFCVDGVCCNEACGGGVSECQSCSTGTCSPLGSPIVCRPAGDPCDAPEVCDGVSASCGPDLKLACADGGEIDAGIVADAGASVDAGSEPDGGEQADAGSTTTVAPGCGCSAGTDDLLTVLLLAMIRRRRQRRRAPSPAKTVALPSRACELGDAVSCER